MSEPTHEAQPARRPRLSVNRRIAAAISIIIMVMTGGCTVLVAVVTNDFIASPDRVLRAIGRSIQGTALLVGGIPFAISLFYWRRAVRTDGQAALNTRPPLRPGQRFAVKVAVSVMFFSGALAALAVLNAFGASGAQEPWDLSLRFALVGAIPFLIVLVFLIASLWNRLSANLRDGGVAVAAIALLWTVWMVFQIAT